LKKSKHLAVARWKWSPSDYRAQAAEGRQISHANKGTKKCVQCLANAMASVGAMPIKCHEPTVMALARSVIIPDSVRRWHCSPKILSVDAWGGGIGQRGTSGGKHKNWAATATSGETLRDWIY
jgi:hypothetical protein